MRSRGRGEIIRGRLLGCTALGCSDEVGGPCEWMHEEMLIFVNNGLLGGCVSLPCGDTAD